MTNKIVVILDQVLINHYFVSKLKKAWWSVARAALCPGWSLELDTLWSMTGATTATAVFDVHGMW